MEINHFLYPNKTSLGGTIYLAGEFFPRKLLPLVLTSKEQLERGRGINLRPVIARTVIAIFNQLIYSLGCSSCSLTVKNLSTAMFAKEDTYAAWLMVGVVRWPMLILHNKSDSLVRRPLDFFETD